MVHEEPKLHGGGISSSISILILPFLLLGHSGDAVYLMKDWVTGPGWAVWVLTQILGWI